MKDWTKATIIGISLILVALFSVLGIYVMGYWAGAELCWALQATMADVWVGLLMFLLWFFIFAEIMFVWVVVPWIFLIGFIIGIAILD